MSNLPPDQQWARPTVGRKPFFVRSSRHGHRVLPHHAPDTGILLMLGLVALACLLLGFSKAGVAGTLGPFVTVLLVLAMPADEAVGLLLPMLIAADSLSLAAHWRQWEGRLIPPVLSAAVAGIALGTLVLSQISEEWLQRLIAISLLGFVIFYATQRGVSIRREHQTSWGLAAGATAGFTSAIAHAGGPPVIVYLMGVGLEPRRFVGTTVVLFSLINVLKVPGYILAGIMDTDLIVSTMWGWLLIPVGVLLGRTLVERVNRTIFERITLVLMITGSLVLLVT